MRDALLVSCEHGGNRIPLRYRPLFRGRNRELRSHLGFDPGAAWLARRIARDFDAPLFVSTVSRLLVDLNRSLHNRTVFSAAVRDLAPPERALIVSHFYTPHRNRIEESIRDSVSGGRRVLHLAVHTFTPVLNGRVRSADVGLLYDPSRQAERLACRRWRALLNEAAPALEVRRNYPYRGSDDGLTTHLRRTFPARSYLGLELEVNQRHLRRSTFVAPAVVSALVGTIHRLTDELRAARTT